MRKFLFIRNILFLYLVVFLLPACEKEDKDEPIVIGGIVEASASDYNPPYGGTSILTWEISNPGIYERIIVKSNNEVLSNLSEGTDTLYSIIHTQKISISCFKKGETEPSLERKLDDIIPQDAVEPKMPSITMLVADPPTLPVGGGITNITWTSNENTLSVVYEGISYPANWTLPVSVTADSTRLVFDALGSDGQRSSTILIRVEQAPPPPPPMTMEDTLCMFGGWWRSKLEFQNTEGEWIEQELRECRTDDVKTFYKTPEKRVITNFGSIRCIDEPEITNDPWSLAGNIITISQVTRQISVDEDTLILVTLPHLMVRETFVHH